MEHFLKSFSIIDFLGIFTPGALVTLAYNSYFGGVTDPFKKFFVDQSITLVIYFIFLAYLSGIVLQEVSKPLEKIVCSRMDYHEFWQSNLKVQELYKKIFQESISVEINPHFNINLPHEVYDDPYHHVWINIYRYVQPEIKQIKIPLFHAFSSMARSCSVASLMIMVMNWYAHNLALKSASPICFTNTICLGVSLLMIYRHKRFHKLLIEYTYISFLQLDREDNNASQKTEATNSSNKTDVFS